MAEQSICNRKVGGSTPLSGSETVIINIGTIRSPRGQLRRRFLAKNLRELVRDLRVATRVPEVNVSCLYLTISYFFVEVAVVVASTFIISGTRFSIFSRL